MGKKWRKGIRRKCTKTWLEREARPSKPRLGSILKAMESHRRVGAFLNRRVTEKQRGGQPEGYRGVPGLKQ